jgi:tetratricopeptide (TPR) repeat protein
MSDRLAQLTKLLDADPNDPFLTYGIAMEHGKVDRFDEAIHWLDRTLSIDPKYCYAYYQKAKMLDAQGDTDQARAVLDDGMTAAAAAGDAHAREEMAELRANFE